jgi:hypothetical protein
MSTLLTITLLLFLCRPILPLLSRQWLPQTQLITGLFEMTPSPPPPLSHLLPANRRKQLDLSIPLESRTVENPVVWNSSYQPPWRRSPPPQLSLPKASTLNSPSLTTSIVTVARIGATERAIERIQVEVSCECRLSHGYDIISLGHSGMVYDTYL